MAKPNPSAQWVEPAGSGAAGTIQLWSFEVDDDGALVPTFERTGIVLRDDGSGAFIPSDDPTLQAARTIVYGGELIAYPVT